MATSMNLKSETFDRVLFGARSIPFDKLDPFSDTGRPYPDYAFVLELDFRIEGDELWFYFSRYNDIVHLRDYGTAAYGGIEKLIDDVCDPGFRFDHQTPIYPDAGLPSASPLSLRNERRSYVIYRLSGKNWQFVRRGYPITAGGPDRVYCFDGFKVPAGGWDEKTPGFPFDSTANPPIDDCKVAFFIADGEKALEDTDDRQYSTAINLHVDIEYSGLRQRIPVMIDPDVRFPGGVNP